MRNPPKSIKLSSFFITMNTAVALRTFENTFSTVKAATDFTMLYVGFSYFEQHNVVFHSLSVNS